MPIASKSKDVLAFLGDLSINGNFALDSVSDFSTLKTIGYGVNWSPIKAVRVIASMIDQDEAPSASQLGDPVIVTPNVRIFDYVTGQTVTVSRTSGGNPFLLADSKHSFKLGLTLKPLDKTDLTLTANYVNTSVRNATASFPAATAQIEAAFPGRFTRDAYGTLTAIDARPVNFARTESSELRWGINFSQAAQVEAAEADRGVPRRHRARSAPGAGGAAQPGQLAERVRRHAGAGLRRRARRARRARHNAARRPPAARRPADGAPPPANAGGAPGAGGPGGGGGFGGGGGGGGGRFGGGGPGGGGGRLNFALYHTWHFTDRVEIAPGVPVIDLLNGGAIGSGGQSRHELEAQAGYTQQRPRRAAVGQLAERHARRRRHRGRADDAQFLEPGDRQSAAVLRSDHAARPDRQAQVADRHALRGQRRQPVRIRASACATRRATRRSAISPIISTRWAARSGSGSASCCSRAWRRRDWRG